MKESSNQLRVLVVDDNRDAADSLSRLVQLWGHEAQVAYDESALGLVASFQPDAVLLDIGMPRLDGIHLARHIRLQTNGAHPLIVAVTGFHDESIRRLSREAGIDHYLLKPIELTVLEGLLAMRLAEKGRAAADGHSRPA